MERQELTLERAFEIQNEGMKRWKSKLNAECYSDLVAFVTAKNLELTDDSDPYTVTRGDSLSSFISSWTNKNHV